ncbi:hypothetical protein LPJ74_004999 [Coemansia sp. RSA 1843]|nr:hypothetical protein LPJ74_004999 [Coemansia sp. RSA 1843]
MHSLVNTSLAMHKQAANMGMMFQTAAPQATMQQIAPVHHPAASATLGIGATLPSAIAASATASFAPNMVVGSLGSFAQPATSLGQPSIMTSSYASQPIDSSSIVNSTTAALVSSQRQNGYEQPAVHESTIQGMRTIAAILPASSSIGGYASGRTVSQFRYSAPQATRSQLQEASESMLGMTIARGPSAILHTQATAESMAAAAAAAAAVAAASNNQASSTIAPIARFHSSSAQNHSTLQRHVINNQTQSYNQHHHHQIPNINNFYYPQR